MTDPTTAFLNDADSEWERINRDDDLAQFEEIETEKNRLAGNLFYFIDVVNDEDSYLAFEVRQALFEAYQEYSKHTFTKERQAEIMTGIMEKLDSMLEKEATRQND